MVRYLDKATEGREPGYVKESAFHPGGKVMADTETRGVLLGIFTS